MKDKNPIGHHFLLPQLSLPKNGALHWARVSMAMAAAVGFFIAGCSSPKEDSASVKSQNPTVAAKDRPPLKVVLVDVAFSEEMSIQWQSSSDQPLRIENISIADLQQRKQDSTDVWIFPANHIGSMISKQLISPLPQAAYGKPPLDEDDSSPSKTESVADLWPARWRGTSRYGGTVYAMPLGAKPLALIAKKIDLSPLVAAEPTVGRSEELSQKSRDAWLSVLKSLPTAPTTVSIDGAVSVNGGDSIDWDQKKLDRLVDHFLFIASTTNARYRGLFDVSKMTAKLDSNDLVQSVAILAELWRVAPNSFLTDATDAWGNVKSSEATSIAIGYPSSLDSLEAEQDSELQLSNLSWNANHGLLVGIGKKTRQSAVSAQFVQWLSASEQRATFARLDSRIELWPQQTDPNSGRNDYRLYTTLINRELRPEPTSLLIRFDNAGDYRRKLAETLLSCLKSPDQAKTLLAECSKAWDKITEQNNAPQQRLSVEQSIGFSQ